MNEFLYWCRHLLVPLVHDVTSTLEMIFHLCISENWRRECGTESDVKYISCRPAFGD